MERDRFLDRSSLFAIAILILIWISWSAHMKKKYPRESKAPSLKEEVLKNPLKEKGRRPLPLKERVFSYSGSRFDLQISSLGMGVKRARLKNFEDRKGRVISFEEKGGPLFATRNWVTNEILPFRVERKKDRFVGWHRSPSLALKKTLVIDDKSYRISVKTEVLRQKKSFGGLSLSFAEELKKEDSKKPWYLSFFFFSLPETLNSFSVSEEGLSRVFKEDKDPQKIYKNLSFAALGTKYFGLAFVNKGSLLPSFRLEGEGEVLRGRLSFDVSKAQQKTLEYLLFLGPKDIDSLKSLHPKAQNWINYGFFDWLARPLLLLLKFFHTAVGNWGFAIVLLTFFIRLLLLPINIKSYRSMKTMQRLQKPIQELRAKYKDRPQELNQRMLALMKENKANPLGGCLPLFLQFPVFFALYRVLGESLELYKAPFIFWVKDLSLKDPLYLFPLLGGAVLFAQQKLTPMNVPKAQERILKAMPLLFSVFMLGLPSGLTLYIFVSGLFGFSQQLFFVKLKD